MTDFKMLVESNSIEDKLIAIQNSTCPSEIITQILNHKNIDWTSNSGTLLITEIVSHINTDLVVLMSIFSQYTSPILSDLPVKESMNQRKLIMQNSNWKMDEIVSVLLDKVQKTDDGDEKCFMVGSIADVDVLDSVRRRVAHGGNRRSITGRFALECSFRTQ